MGGFLQDLRSSFRLLRKPFRTVLIIIITLALGIGATTAVFSIVNAVLLKPLPYQSADRLVTLAQQKLQSNTPESSLAPANFVDIRRNHESFDLIAAYVGLTKILTGSGEAESLNGIAASAELFPLLSASAQIGRAFGPDEDRAQAQPVVIISHNLWQRRFSADEQVLHRAINLDGRLYQVIGVMPAGFDFPKAIDFWIPLGQESQPLFGLRNLVLFSVLAQLKPDISLEKAQAQMDVVAGQLEKSYPATNTGVGFRVTALRDSLVGNVRTSLLLLLAATAVLLLIACVNVSNIFLARAIDRRREVAIRMALGATPFRIIRQFLCECLVMVLISGALGVFLATRFVGIFSWLLPPDHPNASHVTVDLRVLILSAAISIVSGLIFGLIAARYSIPASLTPLLKDGPAGSRNSREQQHTWNVLVVAEIALSVLLCIAAGLLMNSFIRLTSVPAGFDASNLLIVGLRLNQPKYNDDFKKVAFQQELITKLALTHEIEAIALSTFPPMGGNYSRAVVVVNGQAQPAEPVVKACLEVVGGDYFQTLKVPLKSGRFFLPTDTADSANVAIINEAAVRQYFSGSDPLGKTITLQSKSSPACQIVGVVADVRQLALEKAPEPEIFLPYEQSPWAQFSLILRTTSPSTMAVNSVRSTLQAIDADVPLTKITTMDALIAGSVMDRRLKATAFNIFAIFGSVLAAVGLYGLLSHAVKRRAFEIGVRMAIGATAADILRMIIKRGALLIIIGIVIGVLLSLYVTHLLAGLLYGVSTTDALTIASVCLVIMLTGLIACFIPAYRAARIDPLLALRGE
jgi:Acidobacterial duplicated orphan permease